MAGVHGKNAEIRISTGETALSGLVFVAHPDPTLAALGVFVPPGGEENWKFAQRGEDDAPFITYESPALTVKEIDSNSRFIHYAGGAVLIPPEDLAGLAAGTVVGKFTALTMETVANITTEDRTFELNLEADIVDTTVIGEEFKTFVEGIQGWTGSLDGLYLNPERYKLALSTVSGIIPRKLVRLKPRPDKDTYFQGTAIFPTYGFTGGFDSAIERNVEFTGIGPLDLIEDGLPFFPGT